MRVYGTCRMNSLLTVSSAIFEVDCVYALWDGLLYRHEALFLEASNFLFKIAL